MGKTKPAKLEKITDYSEWLDFDLWKVHQAVCLCVGLRPIQGGGASLMHPSQIECLIHDADIKRRWGRLYKKTKDNIKISELKAFLPSNGTTLFLHYDVKPAAYAKWAMQKGFQLPEPITALAKPVKVKKGPGRPAKNTEVVNKAGEYAKKFYADTSNSNVLPKDIATNRAFLAHMFPTKPVIDRNVLLKTKIYARTYNVSLRAMIDAIAEHWPNRKKKPRT